MKIKLLFFLSLLSFTSCTKRNLTYFSDLNDEAVFTEEVSSNAMEPLIQPGDLLDITVTSPNPEANVLFNRGELRSLGSSSSISTVPSPSVVPNQGFLVDKNGTIDFPVLGSIQVGGLSKSEVKSKLTDLLVEYLKDPIVSIRYLNYRITVIGEVNKPSTFVIPSEQITILEALGMAGDMTAYGKRENVLIIRQVEGIRSMVRLDLNNKKVLNSPYFYLQPNDVVYVEPVKARAEQASLRRNNISILLSAASIITLLLVNIL